MKRLLFVLIAIMLMCQQVFAAGTVTITKHNHGENVMTIVFTCTGDSSDGTIPDTSTDSKTYGTDKVTLTSMIQGWFIDKVQVNPDDVTAPDAASVDILDADGIDLLDSNGDNLIHASNSLATVPATDSQNKLQPITGAITLSVSGQDTVDAVYVVTLTLIRYIK